MALFAQQVAYTPVAWAALLKSPQHRLEAVQQVVERLGGTVVDGWLTFGDYDALMICDLPDDVGAAALSMAVSAGGAMRAVRTTPLITFEQGVEAMHRARAAEYAPPRSEIPYFGVYRGETPGVPGAES
jgi:uncharacterized protein with GYD domain